MVKAVREAEKAIGVIDYSLSKKQQKSREFSRSLYVVKNIKVVNFFQHKMYVQSGLDTGCIQNIILKY